MRMTTFGLTDIGRARSNNEDFFLVDGSLLIVADGMGGAAAGEVASSLAVNTVVEIIRDCDDLTAANAERTLRKAILEADRRIQLRVETEPELSGMGTTLVAALSFDERILIGYVGDSRAYVVSGAGNGRGGNAPAASSANAPTVMLQKIDESAPEKTGPGSIRRLTDDHSVVMDLVNAGVIAEDDIRSHPLRNRITRSIGSLGDQKPDFLWYDPQNGDTLILCSDGLWEMVHEDIVLAVVKSSAAPEEMCRRLIAAANDAGGHDNITIIAASFAD